MKASFPSLLLFRETCRWIAVIFLTSTIIAIPRAAIAQITLTASDTSSTVSSFNAAGNWSNGAPPTGGSSYVVNGNFYVKTPSGATSATFAGDSLTFEHSGALGTLPAILIYKGSASGTPTVAIGTLYLNNGAIENGNGGTPTFSGNYTLGSTGGIFDAFTSGRGLIFSANIGGTGPLKIETSGATSGTGTVSLTGTNTYSGGTTVSSYTTLTVGSGSSLGTGSVTLTGTAPILTLQGSANIAGTGSLILSSGSVVNLSFSGTDTIEALSLDGGSTWVTSGTWGAIGSAATYQSADFSGSGLLDIVAVPENGTLALVAFAFCGLAALRSRAAGLRA